MSEDILRSIGTLHDAEMPRDAIHIAVTPVVATTRIAPGEKISFVAGSTEKVAPSADGCGLADPFLNAPVYPGERFWMFMYPGSITSLRHDWTHPAFADGRLSIEDGEKAASVAWMIDFAEGYSFTLDEMIAAGRRYLKHGQYLYGKHDSGDLESESVPEHFWDHYQRITGEMVNSDDRGNFFTCSC